MREVLEPILPSLTSNTSVSTRVASETWNEEIELTGKCHNINGKKKQYCQLPDHFSVCFSHTIRIEI